MGWRGMPTPDRVTAGKRGALPHQRALLWISGRDTVLGVPGVGTKARERTKGPWRHRECLIKKDRVPELERKQVPRDW
ncbi:hypothetical protein XELAEV_18037314mg [Xenopus laevis]|uniref:Uncharacterized protein n=1 Tax=Xenopus laevis TaxID=8355 RepID=A0A974HAJ3_XENLA|nr:hypothetical protein XELAEV_18037314mg [Xenopus laevis]